MRTVVFGAGYWGLNYIRELGRYCIHVVDPDPARRRTVEERFGVAVSAELPARLNYEAAVVVTPPLTHYSVAMPLLEAGKTVLIEKPLATTAKQAYQLATFDKCMAGLVYLYHPAVEELRWQTQCAGSGLSHIFSRRTNSGPVRPYLDVAWDLAVHDISIFNYLFEGLPVGRGQLVGTRDWCVITLPYKCCKGEVPAICYCSWCGAPKIRRVELVAFTGPREVFDDLQIILEEPPLTRMIRAFLDGSWRNQSPGITGAQVVETLENVWTKKDKG